MRPGQRAMQGTLKPPSKTVPFVARNGVMPPSGQVNTSAPLSVVKITIVLSASPISSRCFRSWPTHIIQLSHTRLFDVVVARSIHHRLIFRRKIGEDVHACGIVPDEEWLAIRLGFVHEIALELLTSTSSKVSMSYLALRPTCQFCISFMSGNGAKGPSSTIFCLPILPQRGCSVGSSMLVAQQCTKLRGPVVSIQSWG